MRVYADSSFLVSCYLVDSNTSRAKAFLLEHQAPLPFTTLHDLEVRNALRLGVFRQLLTEQQAHEASNTIDGDLLHVATARAVRCTQFASFDARQQTLGAAAGLTSAL